MARSLASFPLSQFIQINPSVYVSEAPESTTKTKEAPAQLGHPDIILLFSWSGANIKHVAKYIPGYIDLYPTAQIILVTSAFTDFVFGGSASKRLWLEPVIQILTPHPEARILVHLFSNGGSHKLWRLAKLYREKQGRVLPMNAMILDSAPGKTTFERSAEAIAYELPKAWYLRLPGLLLLHLFLSLLWAVLTATGRKSTIDRVWEELNDPDLISVKAIREYIYSKADRLVWWKDVEDHADEAEARGYQVRKEMFENTGHVAHMRLEYEKYWSEVAALWDRVQ
ncbi:hypothetical protein MMC34_004158 [Xylographa carneopallida]|nr:hypothetical protein [Xylographa carneopallida]